MRWHKKSMPVFALGSLLVAAGVTLVAQGVVAQLGQTDANLREHAWGLFTDQTISTSDLMERSVIIAARKGFLKLPPPERAQAMTALYAWMKSYVSSPAFKSAYTKAREDRKPEPLENRGTVDDELKKGDGRHEG
jgi:hypothetical protein